MAHKMILVSLNRYRQLAAAPKKVEGKEEGKAVTEIPKTSSDDVAAKSNLEVDVILSAIPKNFRNRAKSLLNNIMTDPQHILRWNGRGEIIYNGIIVPGSHITDLLNNSQKGYKHLKPIGQHEFREGLRELNISLGLLESGPPGVPNVIEPMVWLRV